MAYADRTTAAMSPLANKWYDTVRTRVLGNRPDPAKKQHLEGLFFKHQAGILLGFANGGLPPSVSADIFRWNVARATWKHQVPDEPFPHEAEKPPTYGVPCCEQWVRKWYMEMQDRKNTKGPRTTMSSSPSATPVEQQTILAKAVLRFVVPTGALMTESAAIRAHEAQQNELDRIALSVITREIGKATGCMRRGELLVKFVEKGHPEVHVLNREDRLRVVQSLVRQNAVDFVNGLVSDSQSTEKEVRPIAESLNSFIAAGAQSAPYITSKSDRLNVIDKVWSELLDPQTLDTKVAVRDMLLSWHQRLPQEGSISSAAGSVATGAPIATSTARPGPDPNSPGAW